MHVWSDFVHDILSYLKVLDSNMWGKNVSEKFYVGMCPDHIYILRVSIWIYNDNKNKMITFISYLL